ncbi:MAG TPA: hypothetical protein VGF90_02355 [Verrucomicrobiae bacterium]
MSVSAHTIGVLARAAAEKIGDFPLAERIKIYHALGESMPNDAARGAAMELSRVLSQAAAMELDFQEQIRVRTNGNK